MANASFDNMWQEAMSSLSEQLHVEGVEEEGEEQGPPSSSAQEVTIFQAFQHFACLYIKYIQIYKKLEGCYDGMIHPQKRIHVKSVLELVIRRIIELKADLVKWNPPNSYLKMPQGPEVAFPWEYVHLDDILVDLKISPEILDISIPHYFKENYHRQIDQRDKLVSGYMHLKHNTDSLYIADPFDVSGLADAMTLDVAIDIIQRNERGRQGYERAALVKELREKEKQGRMYDASGAVDMDPDIAATNLQRMLKGHTSRKIAARERDNEFMFVGMSRRKDNIDIMEKELNLAYRKRKQEQAENKEAYEKALDDFKEIIMDEEGPEKREELREERTLWVTDQIAQDKFPDDLEDFYATKKKGEGEEEAAGDGGKDKKDKGKDKKEEKGGKDKKDKKEKGKKEEGPPEMPKLQGVTELTKAMQGVVKAFEGTWEGRDESDNFQQKHDIELGKQVVRPGVYTEIRKQVDDMLLMNLKKIQMQIQSGGKKGKKKGKKGKKKKKGKKGKKDKKKKPLPGEKIAELKNLDTDQMLSILIESQVVVRSRPKTVKSLIGEFDYLGSIHQSADRKDEGKWDPPDPSIMQIRQAISEYCILPNGSAELKMAIDPAKMIKSAMFYGSSGSGKTHAVEAIASELGALLIHLSPDKLRGQFGGKNGPTKLVHMCFWVARDPTMQPCVIYIDECEQFFTGGKKSKDKDGASRFKKDLLTYKNQALGPEHRVIIIGSTKYPENGEMKDYKGFFDKFLYFPYPDYASRCLIWKIYLEERILAGLRIQQDELDKTSGSNVKTDQQKAAIEEAIKLKAREILSTIDSSSLASVSEGYSAGAIARTVKLVVTARRVALVKTRPLDPWDFLDNLALQDYTFQDDKATYTAFTRQISGMDDRRKKIDAMVAGEDADGGKDKKGGKKK